MYCNASWDGYNCWPATPANETIRMACPEAFRVPPNNTGKLSFDAQIYSHKCFSCDSWGVWHGSQPPTHYDFLGDHIPPPTNPTSHLIVEANHTFEAAGYCWCALFEMNIIQDSGDNSYSTFLSEVPKPPRIVRCVASSKELGISCYFIPRFCVVKRSGSYSGAVTFENDPNK